MRVSQSVSWAIGEVVSQISPKDLSGVRFPHRPHFKKPLFYNGCF